MLWLTTMVSLLLLVKILWRLRRSPEKLDEAGGWQAVKVWALFDSRRPRAPLTPASGVARWQWLRRCHLADQDRSSLPCRL